MALGPLSEVIYFRDYWVPQSVFPIYIGKFPFMIEDLLFGFAIAGIGAVIYEVIFKKRLSQFSIHTKYTIKSLSIVIIFVIILFSLLAFGINSIYASAVALFIATIPIIFVRHDLFLNAIGSGIGVMIIMFLCYIFLAHILVGNTEELLKRSWLIYGTNLDIRFANIPLTEMAWGFTWGFLAGPWYEFMNSKKNVAIAYKNHSKGTQIL